MHECVAECEKVVDQLAEFTLAFVRPRGASPFETNQAPADHQLTALMGLVRCGHCGCKVDPIVKTIVVRNKLMLDGVLGLGLGGR
jgi:hypothetical protein